MWRHDSGAMVADLASLILFVTEMVIAVDMHIYHGYVYDDWHGYYGPRCSDGDCDIW